MITSKHSNTYDIRHSEIHKIYLTLDISNPEKKYIVGIDKNVSNIQYLIT